MVLKALINWHGTQQCGKLCITPDQPNWVL